MASQTSEKNPTSLKSRGWAFTDWNVTNERILFYYHWFNHQVTKAIYPYLNLSKNHWKANIDYLVISHEVCPGTDRHHIQGFIYFQRERAFPNVNAAFINSPGHVFTQDGKQTVHLEKQFKMSTPQDNARYCKKGSQPKAEWEQLKDKGPNYGKGLILWDVNQPYQIGIDKSNCWEYGQVPTGAGHRSDIQEISEMIKNQELKTYDDIVDVNAHLAAQYMKFFDRQIERWRPERDHRVPKNCLCYWGEAGSGKSYVVRHYNSIGAEAAYDTVKFSGEKGNPFVHGYTGKDLIILDDFDPEQVSFQWFLTFLDRYTVPVNVKGGSMKFTANTILVTTNRSPMNWFPYIKEKEQLIALFRRFARFTYVKRLPGIVPTFPEQYEVEIENFGQDNEKLISRQLATMTTEDLEKEICRRRGVPYVPPKPVQE